MEYKHYWTFALVSTHNTCISDLILHYLVVDVGLICWID